MNCRHCDSGHITICSTWRGLKISCKVCGYQYSYEEMREILDQAKGQALSMEAAEAVGGCELKY